MREKRDDARLTAYVLGDLPKSERAEVEVQIAASDDLRREVDEIRATATALRQALAAAPRQELSGAQRAAVETEAGRQHASRLPFELLFKPAWIAAAAVLVLVGMVSWRIAETRLSLRQTASPGRSNTPLVAQNAATPAPPAISAPATAAASPSHHRGVGATQQTGQTGAPVATPTPAALAVVVSSATPGQGERIVTLGTVRGTVVDPSGSAIAGARVTLTNESSGPVLTTQSDARGVFLVAALPPGAYSVRAEMPGFKPQQQSQIAVIAGDWVEVARLELPLSPMTETVTVVGRVPELQASSGERSHTAANPALLGPLFRSDARNAPSTPPPPRPASTPMPAATLDAVRVQSADFNTEAYDHISDNPFILVSQDPRSTFSVDVDTASYSNMRRFLSTGALPPKDAVRIEELINYFAYDYAPPTDGRPFAVHMETAACPWKSDHRLLRIAIKGKEIPRDKQPPSNLVFLLDVSGSMQAPNKLPLVQASMKLLVNELRPQDRVAIVVYAGREGLALPSTGASEKDKILNVIENLSAGGTTQGSAGLKLAYKIAGENFIKGGVNRVILATDGDFNVGITNQGDLIRLIEDKAKSGVFLTALGYGMGNVKDSTLEKLADRGNGNYAYIDSLWEARKVLVEQIGATLVTIAKDVKLQLEFNPATVKAFRLVGYENRVLAHQDFNDDKKDAGEIGAGHTVTALYEIVPVGVAIDVPRVDPLKYQQSAAPNAESESHDLLTLKLRYKQPDASQSQLMELTLADHAEAFDRASTDFRFATAVASFGMVLRDSPYKGASSFENVLTWAKSSLGPDRGSSRAEFVTLVEKARHIKAAD